MWSCYSDGKIRGSDLFEKWRKHAWDQGPGLPGDWSHLAHVRGLNVGEDYPFVGNMGSHLAHVRGLNDARRPARNRVAAKERLTKKPGTRPG
jgi:hypothetical protein